MIMKSSVIILLVVIYGVLDPTTVDAVPVDSTESGDRSSSAKNSTDRSSSTKNSMDKSSMDSSSMDSSSMGPTSMNRSSSAGTPMTTSGGTSSHVPVKPDNSPSNIKPTSEATRCISTSVLGSLSCLIENSVSDVTGGVNKLVVTPMVDLMNGMGKAYNYTSDQVKGGINAMATISSKTVDTVAHPGTTTSNALSYINDTAHDNTTSLVSKIFSIFNYLMYTVILPSIHVMILQYEDLVGKESVIQPVLAGFENMYNLLKLIGYVH